MRKAALRTGATRSAHESSATHAANGHRRAVAWYPCRMADAPVGNERTYQSLEALVDAAPAVVSVDAKQASAVADVDHRRVSEEIFLVLCDIRDELRTRP